MLELSLYQLDQQLTDLWAMRERVEDEIATAEYEGLQETKQRLQEEAQVIDDAMVLYFEALPKKVDSTADAWALLERLCGEPKERKGEKIYCELDLEIARLKARRDAMRKRLESLKTRVQFVMEGMAWTAGKPRKLEGVRHVIYLKGNGGRPAVEVYDESLIPDSLCTVTVTMRVDAYKVMRRDVTIMEQFAFPGEVGPRIPSLSLISARLSEACTKCEWRGQGTVVLTEEQMRTIHPEAVAELCKCLECGGSGKASVPGARLLPLGQHVECK